MTPRVRRQWAMWTFKTAEAGAAPLALATVLLLQGAQPESLLQPPFTLLWPLLALCWHLLLLSRGLYASHRLEDGWTESARAAWSALLCGPVTAVLLIALVPAWARLDLLLPCTALLALLVVAGRRVLRSLLAKVHLQGRNLRFALIVGAGARAQRYARLLAEREELGYRVIGYVDDDMPATAGMPTWLGGTDQLAAVLSHSVVDEVFVMLPMRSSYARIQQVVNTCEEQGTLVTMPADFFSARLARTRTGSVAAQPVLYLSSVPENDWRVAGKRGMDVLGAAALLLLLAPVMALVALGIRLTSPGPVIFRQQRIGLNKRAFMLLKFRTMTQNAEARQAALEAFNEVKGPAFKMRHDPRVTPFGAFLRRTSLDELPQLFNVLRGEMSLVGPRPLPLRDVAGFREDWQRRRFSVLPGITCLWQLSGRSDIPFQRWMELDLEYIDQWSLWLDLSILVRTVPAVLKRSGAY
ncbi:sugar transferase [Aquincola tertiaricarbonis]|uniref:Sugar transferase n=1 Tax=Aquincola tertiaricarbonis TaxID=391953 RepID=A0ABY4SDY2_AQUTE|nr:sugar transferase [Aquincola tertiaricarbonis]URI11527.1 sugar transferase [Aquincola tertiaricarbonis]